MGGGHGWGRQGGTESQGTVRSPDGVEDTADCIVMKGEGDASTLALCSMARKARRPITLASSGTEAGRLSCS